MRQPSGRSAERGYTLLATALALIGMIGMTGLAIDAGRMYVAKNEAQTYADAAALRAALELDGTPGGFQRARDAATQSPNLWNFSNSAFSGTVVEFSQSSSGPWEADPPSAAGYRFVRVRASAAVPISFMRVLVPGSTKSVSAQAAAGQIPKYGFREGLFPFSPFAHDPSSPPNFGLVPGQVYTLRWAASPKLSNANSLCPGDATQAMIDLARAGGGEERGYIEQTSASVIRETIVADYQTVFRQIGDSVVMTGGAKQTVRDALVERVRQDSDTTRPASPSICPMGTGTAGASSPPPSIWESPAVIVSSRSALFSYGLQTPTSPPWAATSRFAPSTSAHTCRVRPARARVSPAITS